MDVDALKREFSLALFSVPGNPFKAACIVFPDDISLACAKAVEWNNDPFVLDEIERLKDVNKIIDESIEYEEVKTKEDALQLAWDMATAGNFKGVERVAALKLFAEMSNYMPDKTVNKNIVTEVKSNRVMVIKDFGDNESWEARAIAQQRLLVNE